MFWVSWDRAQLITISVREAAPEHRHPANLVFCGRGPSVAQSAVIDMDTGLRRYDDRVVAEVTRLLILLRHSPTG